MSSSEHNVFGFLVKNESVITFRRWFQFHRQRILVAAISGMAVLAIVRTTLEVRRLLFEQAYRGAIDLRLHHLLTNRLFSDDPVVTMYPAPSLALLWPLLGWVPWPLVRWWWAATLLVMLMALIRIIVVAAESKSRLERMAIGTFLLSIYPTAIVIGNGQHAIHILVFLLTGILFLHRQESWRSILLASLLLLFSLAKPHFSLPFFWIVLFACRSWRVVGIVGAIYAGISVWIVSIHEQDFVTAFSSWFQIASSMIIGYGNIHSWCVILGIQQWSAFFSLALLAAFGWWVYRHRDIDVWILLGVAALIARIWTYHQLYDDLLIVVPMISLVRIAKQEPRFGGSDVIASILLILLCLSLLQPGTLLTLPRPLGTPFRIAQILLWASTLTFLLYHERLEPVKDQSSLVESTR